MEACESGSMFSDSFLQSINAFVTTAANGFESSWATCCPPMDKMNGELIGSCLSDLYSVNWMEDSDLTDLSRESLTTQFHRVKDETTKSHVTAFGPLKLSHEIVGNYQSTYDKTTMMTSRVVMMPTRFQLLYLMLRHLALTILWTFGTWILS